MLVTKQVIVTVYCLACHKPDNAISPSETTAKQVILRNGWLLTEHGELCDECKHTHTLDREGAKLK